MQIKRNRMAVIMIVDKNFNSCRVVSLFFIFFFLLLSIVQFHNKNLFFPVFRPIDKSWLLQTLCCTEIFCQEFAVVVFSVDLVFFSNQNNLCMMPCVWKRRWCSWRGRLWWWWRFCIIVQWRTADWCFWRRRMP